MIPDDVNPTEIVVRYSLSFDEYLEFCLIYAWASRWWIWQQRLTYFVIGFGTAAMTLVLSDTMTASHAIMAGFVAAAFTTAFTFRHPYQTKAIEQKIKISHWMAFRDHVFDELELAIDEQCLRWRGQFHRVDIAWPAVTNIRLFGPFALIQTNLGTTICLPATAFSSDGLFNQFVASATRFHTAAPRTVRENARQVRGFPVAVPNIRDDSVEK